MTNLTPLSPAAQAVLDAFYTGDGDLDYLDRFARYDERIAAALRAAADQAEPDDGVSAEVRQVLNRIPAIAAELEGAQ